MAGRKATSPLSLPEEPGLDAFFDMLAAERGAAANTIAAYRGDLADFAAHLARRGATLAAADGEAVRAYIQGLGAAGLATGTSARKLSALRQFYRFLAAEGMRDDDPTAAIDSPARGGPCPRPSARTRSRHCSWRLGAMEGWRGCGSRRCSRFFTPPGSGSANWWGYRARR